ncbi:MAG: hypothetical protein A3F54_02990 [Candidatus Kerfeldbacteria bacterium RIFCSPHIGHO2_12_FULL_48_17]|uniref:Sortilin N-terminal domain-containing protein n=1 Tax=Candidatus Kerfeldbacteria bacterium RIFCSPHIGHO2_12_FULL_48_17 TaxID=1798542 RepID=A0A1G2B804_9BACT|nr:MAG: hypothetical protein A3F54_02990 [Candidatus Kerfeldbacteria bacterium RIFCSPHIGHO2_12_FULL_48_17]
MKKYILLAVGMAIFFGGCGAGANNTTVNNNTPAGANTDNGYVYPGDVYPEQVSIVEIGENGHLYAAVNEINKYAYPAAISKYNLNPNPAISDNYDFLGVLTSTDSGKTWTKVFTFQSDLDHKKLYDIVTCIESDRQVVYQYFQGLRSYSAADNAGSMHIYVSQDSGNTWTDQGVFALKPGNQLEIISVSNRDQTEAEPIPFSSLQNMQTEKGNCGHVFFDAKDGKDSISSNDYGQTWTRALR